MYLIRKSTTHPPLYLAPYKANEIPKNEQHPSGIGEQRASEPSPPFTHALNTTRIPATAHIARNTSESVGATVPPHTEQTGANASYEGEPWKIEMLKGIVGQLAVGQLPVIDANAATNGALCTAFQ
jgi:hypothetical protein